MSTLAAPLRNTFAIALLAFAVSRAPAATYANNEELNSSKQMMAYVLAQPMLETLYQLGQAADRHFKLQTECKNQYHLQPTAAVVYAPIDFPEGKANPVKGIWAVRFQLERCGETKTYNALFFGNETGETPTAKLFYPGSTRAGPRLVRDAMKVLQPGAVAASGQKECKEVDPFEMRVTEPPHDVVEDDKTLKGVWNEVWTFRICGTTVDAGVAFIPDADGPGASFAPGPYSTVGGVSPSPVP